MTGHTAHTRPLPRHPVLGQRVLAIIRSTDPANALQAARSVLAAGLRSVEVALTTPSALEVITQLVREHPHAVIGAGTVLDIDTANRAQRAGARFLVCPHLDVDLVRHARSNDLDVFPGVATVSEIMTATRAGATAVKLFPASAFAPSFLRDIRAPLPGVQVVPTGGVTISSALEWIAAGAAAVGMGSALTSGSSVEVTARTRDLLATLGTVSSETDESPAYD